jgi:hypothetical protein
MAESDISIHTHVVDNKIIKVSCHTSPFGTENSSSIQLATTSVSTEDCDYLRVMPDELNSGEMLTAASEFDVTNSNAHSNCAQQQQHRERNTATMADEDMYMAVIDDSDTHSRCVYQQRHYKRNSPVIVDDGMYMAVTNASKNHVYTAVIADSDLTDSVST